MEFESYASSLSLVGIAACLAICLLLLKEHKNIGTFLMIAGFTIVTVTHFSIYQCFLASALDLEASSFPIMCNPMVPYVDIIGFAFIAIGLGKLFHIIKQKNA